MSSDATDPHLWLEDVTGERQLDWVREHNARTVAEYTDTDGFRDLQARIREVLDTDARIPYGRRRGEFVYNYWRDAHHVRGLWRRTTVEDYLGDSPTWDVLVDLDAVAAAEDENWVWSGAQVLRPDQQRALVSLSRGGADAVVVREFDLATRSFVDDGFAVPEAKTDVAWIDGDTVFVGTDSGPGSLTESGYPRLARRWRRGTPLDAAETVFAGETTDVAVSAWHDPTPGYARSFVERAIDFYTTERYELVPTDDGDRLVRWDLPGDARASLHRDHLLVRTRSEWLGHPAGTLLAFDYPAFLDGDRDPTVLFAPDEHTALEQYAWTAQHLLVVALRDVRTRLSVLTPGPEGWSRREVDLGDRPTSTSVIDTDPLSGDDFFLNTSGFTTPATLLAGSVGGPLVAAKQAPSFFDATGVEVRQHFVTSDDGTEVPYFVVGRELDRPRPTLLYGYGGFENSMLPAYSGIIGRAWLEPGNTYVVANIRGGGEYGPTWHTGAIKENRPRAFEDFAAVARDLVRRGITTAPQLGAQGGSNGGLLMGVMLTRYPELFGAIVCQVPLLDMKRYHLLLAGASWTAEYGEPDDPEQWAYLGAYSPYQNTDPAREYPDLLMTTSTRDDRVHPGHARKMTALLETQGRTVHYYENIEGGHGGAADNEQASFKSALTYTFLAATLPTTPAVRAVEATD